MATFCHICGTATFVADSISFLGPFATFVALSSGAEFSALSSNVEISTLCVLVTVWIAALTVEISTLAQVGNFHHFSLPFLSLGGEISPLAQVLHL